jgi:uncharacterized protein YecA (UPF0149 family)
VNGYKGYDKNLKCRDKQFEIGKTYEEEAKLCNKGLHFNGKTEEYPNSHITWEWDESEYCMCGSGKKYKHCCGR